MTELTPTKIERMLLGHGTLSDMTIETIWTSVYREKELKLVTSKFTLKKIQLQWQKQP
jgi:hypothetical protein